MSGIEERITEYLLHGGLFNPELMQHDAVRDLLIDCRAEIARLRLTDEEREAIHWVVGDVADITGPVEVTLRGLLERLGGER